MTNKRQENTLIGNHVSNMEEPHLSPLEIFTVSHYFTTMLQLEDTYVGCLLVVWLHRVTLTWKGLEMPT